MKAGHCLECRRYQHCRRICRLVAAELARIEKPRRKHRVELVTVSELSSLKYIRWNNEIYSGYDDEREKEEK